MRLSDDARIFEVAVPNVISGKRHPGSVRLGNAFRDTVDQVSQVRGSTHDALARIKAIVHAQMPGSNFGQHHDATHAGR